MVARRIYIAGPFAMRESLLICRDALLGMGHAVTSSWLNQVEPECDTEMIQQHPGDVAKFAEMDMRDIASCQLFMLFTSEKKGVQGRGGHHTELGIAMGLGKDIIHVGPRLNVFHTLPRLIHYNTFTDLVETWAAADPSLGKYGAFR